jgi:hypothetical protein
MVIFLYRKMHAWVWDDQAILLLKTLIPRKGELLRSSAASAKQGNATSVAIRIWDPRSGIRKNRIRDPGRKKSRIRDKHPGSATLNATTQTSFAAGFAIAAVKSETPAFLLPLLLAS